MIQTIYNEGQAERQRQDRQMLHLWETNIKRMLARADRLRVSAGLPPWEYTSAEVTKATSGEWYYDNPDGASQLPWKCPIYLPWED